MNYPAASSGVSCRTTLGRRRERRGIKPEEIESEWARTAFAKSFYNRLSMCFGNIAHYDLNGFYETWFTSDADRLQFLRHTLDWLCWGDPEFTFCDVERAIQQEIRKRNY